jgi:hypothetical protein
MFQGLALAGKDLRQALHRGRDELVGVLDGTTWFVHKGGLNCIPLPAELLRLIGRKQRRRLFVMLGSRPGLCFLISRSTGSITRRSIRCRGGLRRGRLCDSGRPSLF